MPHVRNLIDYSTEDTGKARRPHETLVDIAYNDSIQRLTIYIEPRMFIQLSRIETTEKGQQGWQLVTNVDVVKTHDNAILTQVK